MASTGDHARTTRATGAAAAVDRARDFRRARRHSALVGTMRYLLPLVAVGSAAVYGWVVLDRSGWGRTEVAEKPTAIGPENLTMKDPHYHGFNADGGRYTVRAATADQDLKNPKVVRLDHITGHLDDAKGVRTELKARNGVFDTGTHRLDLGESVEIDTSDGMKARLKSAQVMIKDSMVTTRDPVQVEMSAGRVSAREMQLRHKARQVSFAGEVTTRLNGPAETAAPVKSAADAARPFGTANGPIDIASDTLAVDDNAKTARFAGRVRAVQAGATLESPALDVTYSGAAPGVPDAPPAAAPAQGKVKSIVAAGPVVMTQANGDRATSDRADFDAENARVLLDGNVIMSQEPDRRAASDRAEIDQRAETVLLTGNVVVTQGKNRLDGRRLATDRKSGRTRLTAATADGGNGRIAARFVRNQSGTAQPAKAADAPAAPSSPFGATFKTDPSAPIDVAADSLDINDQRKAAVFTGNVQAVQAGFTLRTAEMTAFYTGEAGLGTTAKPDGKPASGKGSADLQRIEARKAVVVQSQDGQTATGDWADYDTRKNTVTIGGDVVLTRGPNVVRGSRLVIDMSTGHSVIETGAPSGWAARAQPANGAPEIAPPAAGGRPSAVFYPKALKDKAAAGGATGDASKPAARAPSKRQTIDGGS